LGKAGELQRDSENSTIFAVIDPAHRHVGGVYISYYKCLAALQIAGLDNTSSA
jgi:hypothetical protein